MYNVNVNYESPETVILNFEEMIEVYSDIIDECEDKISEFKKEYPHLKENIDEPQDYYYVITCTNEDEASDVECYLEAQFSELEDYMMEMEYEEECC